MNKKRKGKTGNCIVNGSNERGNGFCLVKFYTRAKDAALSNKIKQQSRTQDSVETRA